MGEMQLSCKAEAVPNDIDVAALRERYRQERERRLRPEGQQQYVEAAEGLAQYYEVDPYSPPRNPQPISRQCEVLILGGGFAGLIAAARLKKAGIEDVCIVEMGGDLGGTWYWNRYPGAQCDVESYSYLPLLEELEYMPKERYSFRPEIHEHCQRIGRHFGLYEQALFGTIVRSLVWNEEENRWLVGTDHGDDLRARFVIVATGPLNKPKLPGIPGIETFRGHSFHTARWDYDYTGGNQSGGLTGLADKRVGIIGTGATAIQCVPFLGESAQHLYVFQRTPSYVDQRGNRPTDPEWATSLTPGWQLERQRILHAAVFEGFGSPDEDLVCDGWGEIARNVAARLNDMGRPDLSPQELSQLRELEDYKAMERIRRRVDSIVADPATAEALKPFYKFLCKRPCFNDDYLPTFNRPNVTLVDVSGERGVERITENAVIANGQAHEVDCLIFASGFEVTQDFRRRFGIPVIEGRGEVSLYDHWANGFATLHGMTTHGFPNLFFTGYTQNAAAAAINLMYDQQGGHIAHIISETLERGARRVEPSREAMDGWVRYIRENRPDISTFWTECTPGYYNKEGAAVGASPIYGDQFGGGYYEFDDLLAQWRADGGMPGMVLG